MYMRKSIKSIIIIMIKIKILIKLVLTDREMYVKNNGVIKNKSTI